MIGQSFLGRRSLNLILIKDFKQKIHPDTAWHFSRESTGFFRFLDFSRYFSVSPLKQKILPDSDRHFSRGSLYYLFFFSLCIFVFIFVFFAFVVLLFVVFLQIYI